MVKTVGEFTFDSDTGTLTGPAEYIRSPEYAARIASIEAGTDVVFTAGLEFGPDAETALLVSIQTDYAGWKGARDFNAMREASR